jgi:hypothetical protein
MYLRQWGNRLCILNYKRRYPNITKLSWNNKLPRVKKFTANNPLIYMALNVSALKGHLQWLDNKKNLLYNC